MFPILALLLACSTNPHEAALPPDFQTWTSDTEFQELAKQLPEEEKKLLLAFGVRQGVAEAFGQDVDVTGLTIGDAIERQRTWAQKQAAEEAEKKRIAEEARQKKEAALTRLREAVRIEVFEKTFVKADYRRGIISDQINVSLVFENKTERPVAGVKGTVVFEDLFGDVVKRINLSYDDGIPAQETATWRGSIRYNQFMDGDTKLAQTPLEKLSTRWEPEAVVFEGGTTWTLEE